jgi:hypothetical protein
MQTEGAATMTASPSSTPGSKSSSRRALLAGALGGIAAWAASAVGRAGLVRGGVDGDVILGIDNGASTTTKITNLITSQTVLWGASSSGVGVYGSSSSNNGVWGTSDSSSGVYGLSTSGTGVRGATTSDIAVFGSSQASGRPAVLGQSYGNSTAVQGYSGTGDAPATKAKTAVYGYAGQDSSSKGIYGESPAGWAGYFSGKVYVSKYQEMTEINPPTAPGVNKARIFLKDDGAGHTQLCVRFNTGSAKVLATQT